jgi:hypothetical protein
VFSPAPKTLVITSRLLRSQTLRDTSHPSLPAAPAFAGLHLSGPNANKTALAVLRGDLREGPLKIEKVYEKIGAFGTLFSDERLVGILTHVGPFGAVFIDCPLTVPPCVACQRPVCPGVVRCDDVSVAYMLAISSKVRRRGARKARPVNPQSQRLWDVLQLGRAHDERLEPSYSANLAPLVTRARTLQRRLNSLSPVIELGETSVANALEALRGPLGLAPSIRQTYRSFEEGRQRREEVLASMLQKGWMGEPEDDEMLVGIARSVESFHAFIAACVAALHGAGLTNDRPSAFLEGEGWVHLPEVASDVAWPV